MVEGSKEDDSLLKAKILQLVQEKDGMKKIVDLWLERPSYAQDLIENTLSSYFVHNNIGLESLHNVFPKELIECIKEFMVSESSDRKEE